MVKLENKTIEKLASEGKISHIPENEAYQIYKNLLDLRIKYNRILASKTFYSHNIASQQPFNA
jgi:hypothetical protein